jgi:hypothetical protein
VKDQSWASRTSQSPSQDSFAMTTISDSTIHEVRDEIIDKKLPHTTLNNKIKKKEKTTVLSNLRYIEYLESIDQLVD